MRSHTRKRSATAPFLLIAALVSSMVIGPSVLPASAAVRSKDLTGVWTGNWMADDGRPGGAVEMILAEDPVEGTMVAHITFIDGSQSDTVRREGRLTGEGILFALVGGGTMVVTLASRNRLTGEFTGGYDTPLGRGSFALSRRA
jgi:hypothetical protein